MKYTDEADSSVVQYSSDDNEMIVPPLVVIDASDEEGFDAGKVVASVEGAGEIVVASEEKAGVAVVASIDEAGVIVVASVEGAGATPAQLPVSRERVTNDAKRTCSFCLISVPLFRSRARKSTTINSNNILRTKQ
jgi:hypothetical protein